jgi:hypothetical protein
MSDKFEDLSFLHLFFWDYECTNKHDPSSSLFYLKKAVLLFCSCLQIAKAFGASQVIAVDVLDEKLQNATTLGATHTVNAANDDAVESIKVCLRLPKFVIYQ